MSWQNEMVLIVRHLINDLDDSNQSFSDERLEGTVLVSAQLLLNEIDFDDPPNNDYTVDVDGLSLTPDPTSGEKDNAFINLVCLKTACVIIGSEVRTNALNSIVLRDGPSTIDMRGVTAGLNNLYDSLCKKFDDGVLQYKAGGSRVGQAIFSPYSPGSESIGRHGTSTRQGYFGD